MSELKPCPFCGCSMSVRSNRDWHRPDGDHDELCTLYEHDMMFPATEQGMQELLAMWNMRRTKPRAALSAATASIVAQPAGTDERELFIEAARNIRWPDGSFKMNADGEFAIRYTEWAWKLWQARAAIEWENIGADEQLAFDAWWHSPIQMDLARAENGPYDTSFNAWKARSVLATRPQERQAVPDGWQCVPKEPTEIMYIAGACGTDILDSWNSMLAVAPAAPDDGGV